MNIHPPISKPSRLPLLALADAIGGWWCGVQTHCATCGGKLVVDPPLLDTGQLYCLMCGRQIADVVERWPERVSFKDLPRERRGRAPIHDPSLPCSDCGATRQPNHPRCSRCTSVYYRSRDPSAYACSDCGKPRAKSSRPRCRRCTAARQIVAEVAV